MGKTAELSLAQDTKHSIADNGVLAGYRNKLINGDFDIWQRATSKTETTLVSSAYIAVDRWRFAASLTSGSVTVSRQTHTIGQTDVPGNPKYFWQVAGSSAATGTDGYMSLSQPIESVYTLAGKKVTITGYVRSPNGARGIGLHVDQYFGSGGTPSPSTPINVPQFTVGTTWTKIQAVVDIPSIIGKTLGSNPTDFLRLYVLIVSKGVDASYYGMAPAIGDLNSDIIQLSHFSMVEGDATAEDDPFSPRHIQQELALCHRYYWTSAPNKLWLFGYVGGAGDLIYTPIAFPPMRANPTITASSVTYANGTGITWNAFASGGGYMQLNGSTSAGMMNGSAILELDAEI